MHKCTSATITVHICTVTVALLYIILIISNFAHFSVSLFHLQNQCFHHLLLPLIHTLPQTQNKKSTTKIKNQPQTPQNQTHPHTDTPTETERMDWCLDWQVDWREEQGVEEEEVAAAAVVNGEPQNHHPCSGKICPKSPPKLQDQNHWPYSNSNRKRKRRRMRCRRCKKEKEKKKRRNKKQAECGK